MNSDDDCPGGWRRAFADRRAAQLVQRATKAGAIHTRAQAQWEHRNLTELILHRLKVREKQLRRRQTKEGKRMLRLDQEAAHARCLDFPQRVFASFRDWDYEAFQRAVSDSRIPSDIKDRTLHRLVRCYLFRYHALLARDILPIGRASPSSSLHCLPAEALAMVLLHLPFSAQRDASLVCRRFRCAAYTVMAEDVKFYLRPLAEWVEPDVLISACDCNALPTLPPMAVMVVPCAALLARHLPPLLPVLLAFCRAAVPAAQDTAALRSVLRGLKAGFQSSLISGCCVPPEMVARACIQAFAAGKELGLVPSEVEQVRMPYAEDWEDLVEGVV